MYTQLYLLQGNANCHIILRGGKDGPNYDIQHVNAAVAELQKTGVNHKIMVDCSHGNSSKLHTNQLKVADSVVCVGRYRGAAVYNGFAWFCVMCEGVPIGKLTL